MVEGGESKSVGRPAKRDYSYVKLDALEDNTIVNTWIEEAKECVAIRGLKGEEATSYVMYHVRGGAKIELSVEMSEGEISLERIWGILNKRG